MKKKPWKQQQSKDVIPPVEPPVEESTFTAVVRVKFNNGQAYEGKAVITLPLHWVDGDVPHYLLSDAHLEEIVIQPYYNVSDQIQVGDATGPPSPPVITPQPLSVKPAPGTPVGALSIGPTSRAETRQ